ncbi:RNA-guided pseudouridylation complex pseudouridine synthase subunit Cbf5 [Sulfolobus acidocaldarius DSM 639]|nr:RNA-guided pseudouridylation complex pseudouridine synthase subunit Cbf5 [Sulfolobus acidocaldarius DSM 639]
MGLENATKLMNYISKSGKEYICLLQMHCNVDQKELKEIISQFVGEIYQKPPVRSSVKRRIRKRRIYAIDILDMQDKLILLRVQSDAGTYMRKLCHDVGVIAGCGSHMRELRRIRSGIFTEKTNMVTLQEVSESLYLYRNCKDESELRRILLPMEYGVCGIPKVIVSDTAVNAITYGAKLNLPGILAYQNFRKNQDVAVLTLKGELVAIGESIVESKQLESGKKGEVIRPKRIFMERDIYPKSWK